MFTIAWRLTVHITIISNAISSLTVLTAESALFVSSLNFHLSLFSNHDMLREREASSSLSSLEEYKHSPRSRASHSADCTHRLGARGRPQNLDPPYDIC